MTGALSARTGSTSRPVSIGWVSTLDALEGGSATGALGGVAGIWAHPAMSKGSRRSGTSKAMGLELLLDVGGMNRQCASISVGKTGCMIACSEAFGGLSRGSMRELSAPRRVYPLEAACEGDRRRGSLDHRAASRIGFCCGPPVPSVYCRVSENRSARYTRRLRGH
jgi:hypothetical protein